MNPTSSFYYKKNEKVRKSRTDEAVDAIEKMIQSNEWEEGHVLPSQRALAEKLEFSRPTIREALVSMETVGRVSIRPGKGVFLQNSINQVSLLENRVTLTGLAGRESQMYQFRYTVEPAIAGLVALNATAAQVEDMGSIIMAMKQAMNNEDYTEFFKLDFAFHSHMIEAANNRFFTEAIAPFLELFFESQKLPLSRSKEIEETVLEHEKIMDCIRSQQSVAAKEAMECHICGVAERAGIKLMK